MSRSPILAKQFITTAPAVAAALQEHCADREALLQSLLASFQAEEHIHAAWLWGSFGRGEADDLSDLDPWLIVSDDAVAEMGSLVRRFAENTGNFIFGSEDPQNGPPGGGSFGSLHAGRHGLLHLDCYWEPVSSLVSVPDRAVLLNRLGAVPNLSHSAASPGGAESTRTQTEDQLGFAWLMFSIAAKALARDPASDLGLMLYPRPGLEDAAARLGYPTLLTAEDWAVPEEPLAKVERLRHLVSKTEHLRRIANAQGNTLSPLYAPCLRRYLDLVAGVLAKMR